MCYNAEVSLNTFIFGCVSALLLLISGYKTYHILIIILSFTSIQFLEYLTWKNINNKKINRYLSIFGLIIIIIQILLINYFLPIKKYRNILLTILIIGIILFIIFELKNVNFKMEKGENGHLIWYWLDLPIIWVYLGILAYLIPTYFSNNINMFIYVYISVIISLYFYYKYKTWGSMWCYLSNILWIYLIIRYIIIEKIILRLIKFF